MSEKGRSKEASLKPEVEGLGATVSVERVPVVRSRVAPVAVRVEVVSSNGCSICWSGRLR